MTKLGDITKHLADVSIKHVAVFKPTSEVSYTPPIRIK